MAVNLDTRLPMSAITGPLNPVDMLMKVQQFQQQQQANALQQRLAELRAKREEDILARRERAGKSAYERLQGIQQGIPAQIDTVPQPMKQGPVLNQPAYGATMQVERAPAVPGRELTPEDYSREMANALFQQGDYEGAFEAMKNIKSGQQQQMRAYGADFKIGKGGEYYAPNLTTGRLEPTGIYSPEKIVPQKQPRAPRTQVVSDETGTYVISLDNPQAPAVPVTKPGGVGIVKPIPQKEASLDENKNAGFYHRMQGVDSVISQFEKSGTPNVLTSMAASMPFIGGYASRVAMTPEQQQYRTAAMAWIRAKLRKESGAVIGDDEARSEWETYFPVPGDDQKNIQQKARLRKLAEDEMRISSGKAAGKAGQTSTAYQEYLDAYNRASTPEQKRAITDRARKLGVVK